MEGRVREDDEDFDGVENDGDALRKRAGGRHGDDVSRERFCKESKAVRRTSARVGKEEKSVFDSKKLTEEEETTIEEFNGYKVQVDEEFSQSGMTTKQVQQKEVSLFRATKSPATAGDDGAEE